MNLNSVALKTIKKDDELVGSTSVVLNSNIILIIGGMNHDTIKNPYLSMKLFSLIDYEYKTLTINTNGILNTMFHSTTILYPGKKNQSIFLFGGKLYNKFIKNDIVKYRNSIITIQDTDFGFNITNILNDDQIGREGMTVNTVGKDLDKALVFGGCTTNNQYLNDILLLNQIEDNNESNNNENNINQIKYKWDLKALPTEGEQPPKRAYHSSVVAGDSNQSIIIFGGKDEKYIYQDLWVLDITSILNPVDPSTIAVDPKAKKGAPPVVTAPSGIWTKLFESSVTIPRFMHFSLISNSNIDSSNNTGHLTFCIFGGISMIDEVTSGISLKEIWSTNINFLGERKYQANDFVPVEITDNSNFISNNTLYGSASVPIIDKISNDDPNLLITKCSASFIFGGSRRLINIENNDDYATKTLYLAVDIKSKLVQAAKKVNNLLLGIDDSLLNVTKTQINYPNGDVYIGFAMDVTNENTNETETIPHGIGKMTFANGEYFEGEYKNGKRNGKFKHTTPSGIKFVGDFVNDLRNGEGKLSQIIDNVEKDIYTGSFKDDMYHGSGLLIEEGGNYHRGLFANNLKHGKGVFYNATLKKSIEGEWNKNILYKGFTAALKISSFNGKSGGNFDSTDSSNSNTISGVYSGMVTDGRPDTPFGQDATCLYDDGSKYVGGFRAGRRNGFGTFTTPKGDKYVGKYVADKLNGTASWSSEARGERFEGLWENHKPNGRGKYYYIDGATYDGEWKDGKRHGRGILVFSSNPSPRKRNMTKYEVSYNGDWVEDVKEGYGVIEYSDGSKVEAQFKSNIAQ